MDNNHMKFTNKEKALNNFNGNNVDINCKLEDLRYFLVDFQTFIENIKLEIKNNNDLLNQNRLKYNFEESHGIILRQSLIITLFKILEKGIYDYCKIFETYSINKIKLNDLKGDVLERFKTYSIKIAFLPFKFNSELWSFITGLQDIRNCIIHNDGDLENFGKKEIIKKFAKRYVFISIENNIITDINLEGCLEAIEKIREFFDIITKLACFNFSDVHKED